MKLMIASDIHGSAEFCRELLNRYEEESPDKLLLLGDILYHGPRNDLPCGYNPKSVIEMLNNIKDSLICVRGNCDAEVDQMVLDFPIMADYAVLSLDDKTVFATHGHIYNEGTPPSMSGFDVMLCGHTHIPAYKQHDGYVYINPGSVSIPKEEGERGYIIYEDNKFVRKNLQGDVIGF